MTARQIRKIISTIIYGFLAIVSAIILIRILLKVIGANPNSEFVIFWYNLSANFTDFFRFVYPDITAGNFTVEIFSIIALLFYDIAGLLVSKLAKSFTESDFIDLLNKVIDSLFKFLEFILIGRFILKLTAASTQSKFVQVTYDISAIIYEPFKGILPGFTIPSLNVVFEPSTLLAIIVIIIFDLAAENIVSHLHRESAAEPHYQKQPKPAPVQQIPVQNYMPQPFPQVPLQQPNLQNPANITINIPHQPNYVPVQPQVVDRRTVQVFTPPQQPNYPQYGQNNLEQQRPQRLEQKNTHNQTPNNYQVFYGQPPAPRNPYN